MRLLALAALLCIVANATQAAQSWDLVRDAKCSATKTSSDAWDTVLDQADAAGINKTCKALLVEAECLENPRFTIGQALASILYKIEFGKALPHYRCGA